MADRAAPRATSLGRAVNQDTSPPLPTAAAITGRASARSRSMSEANEQQSRPRLFSSIREAMEYEAAHKDQQKKHQQRARAASEVHGPVVTVRDLSVIEDAQADEAGYTVIRQCVASSSDRTTSVDAGTRAGERKKSSHTTRSGGRHHDRQRKRGDRNNSHAAGKADASEQGGRSRGASGQARRKADASSHQRTGTTATDAAHTTSGAPSPLSTDTPLPPASNDTRAASWESAWPGGGGAPSVGIPSSGQTATTSVDESVLTWLESTLTREKALDPAEPTSR